MMLDFLQGYEHRLLEGALLTIKVALFSLLVAVILGMLGALARLSSSRYLRSIATLYTTVIRGIPDLVLMMLIFFGGQVLLNNFLESGNDLLNQWLSNGQENQEYIYYLPDYIDVNPFFAGVFTLGFIFGAYMAETFRGAILAVNKGELEAAKSYGMSPWLSFRHILFPQMIRHALPGFGNNWLVLLKTTALVSLIGLNDVVFISDSAAKTTKMPFVFFMAVSVIFLIFTSISIVVLKFLERKYTIHAR